MLGTVVFGDEDLRLAVQISSSLSQAIMTASLTILTIIGAAYAAFLPQLQRRGLAFYINIGLLILATFAFIASIWYGGEGIATAYREGAKGTWSIDNSKPLYNKQAIFACSGLLLSAFLVVSWAWQLTHPDARSNEQATETAQTVAELKTTIGSIAHELHQLNEQIARIQTASPPSQGAGAPGVESSRPPPAR